MYCLGTIQLNVFYKCKNLDKLNRHYQVLLAPDTNSGAEIEIAAPFRTPQLKLNCDQDPKSNHPRLERSTAIGPLKQVGSLGCYGSFMNDVTQECDTFVILGQNVFVRYIEGEGILSFFNRP